jgi:hypothetical protein
MAYPCWYRSRKSRLYECCNSRRYSKVFSSICSDYKKAVKANAEAEKESDKVELQPIIFVVDSWSAALTAGQWKQAVEGEMKGDQGQKAKQTGDLILKVTHLVAGLPILCLGVAHING